MVRRCLSSPSLIGLALATCGLASAAVARAGIDPPERGAEQPSPTTRPSPAAPAAVAPVAPPTPPAPPGAEEAIKRFAQSYRTWPRISDFANFAPTDCMARPPSGVLMSESRDEKSHGRKLYFLYMKEQAKGAFDANYATAFGGDPPRQPVGQAFVKQSWKALEVPAAAVPRDEGGDGFSRRPYPDQYLVTDSGAWKAGEQAELYVMYKMDPATEGTDRGWVYATLEPDGSKVIQIGRIASCMSCHEDAGHDRVFGQPRARHDREARERAKKPEAGAAERPTPASEHPPK
jgi:hypothetical protein